MISCDSAIHPIGQLVLAHGAGAGKDSDFMQQMSDALVAENVSCIRFNFPYMEKSIALGKRHPPNRMPLLLESYESVLAELDRELPVFVGGKSMGGRVASMLFENSIARGCICLGYPFHPPGKPLKLRVEHLLEVTKPMLILQGERDTFGNRNEIPEYDLPSTIRCQFLEDGDHSFKPRKASGFSQIQHIESAAKLISKFIKEQL